MVQCVQGTTLDHWVKSVAGVQLEKYNSILHNPKDKREVCARTEDVMELMWTGGGRPYTQIVVVPKAEGILGRSVGSIKGGIRL